MQAAVQSLEQKLAAMKAKLAEQKRGEDGVRDNKSPERTPEPVGPVESGTRVHPFTAELFELQNLKLNAYLIFF